MPQLTINEERCKACSICIQFCPEGCLRLTDKFNAQGYHPVGWFEQTRCSGCGICARMCPDVVIEVRK